MVMKYRKLGQTDLDVSVICLGTMTYGEQNTESEAHEQLDYAVSQGINFIDTAELYPVPPNPETQGRTETYIGSWLNKRGKRDDLIIATKAAGPGEWVSHIRGGPRFNKESLFEAVEQSLSRLQTDYIDLYQLHWPERKSNYFSTLGYVAQKDEDVITIEETLSALNELVIAGKIRHIGLSNETPWGVAEFLHLSKQYHWPRIVSIQNPYSLLNRSFEVGLAEFAWREQTGLLAYSPMAFGVLSGKYLEGMPDKARITLFPRFSRYTNDAGIKATRAYVELAKSRGLDPAQMALAFVNTRPFVTANIIGATSMEQLRQNIASIDLELDEETLTAIDAIHAANSNPCP